MLRVTTHSKCAFIIIMARAAVGFLIQYKKHHIIQPHVTEKKI